MGHEHSEEGGCCGHDENFMDDMPIDIRRRVHALEHLHSKRASVAAEFRNELLALERKFELKYAPFNEEVRRAFLYGALAPFLIAASLAGQNRFRPARAHCRGACHLFRVGR